MRTFVLVRMYALARMVLPKIGAVIYRKMGHRCIARTNGPKNAHYSQAKSDISIIR